MAVRKYSPVTPGTRFRVGNEFTEITTDKPEKSLIAPMSKSGGRNNSGRRTMRHIGGGHKRRYRIIDFKRDKEGVKASVEKTGKALVLTEDTQMGSIASDISSWISESCFQILDAPVMTLGSLNTPIPFSKSLEEGFLAESRLFEKINQLLDY